MHIVVYMRTTEPYSQSMVQYLKSKNVDFIQIDVSVDPQRYDEMVRKSGQKRVPVIDIGGRVIVGFKPRILETVLQEISDQHV